MLRSAILLGAWALASALPSLNLARDCGGAGDGVTLNDGAWAACLARVAAAGGGLIFVPAGVFLSSPFNITTSGTTLVLGGTAEGATGNDVTILLKDALGLNLKMIAGYPDSGALFLAADRKEIDGRFVGHSAVASSKPDWLKPDSQMRVLMQFARKTRHKDFPDAPTARELAPNARALALVELAEIPYSLSRPFVAPPGLPADRASALQKAFLDANADPDYLVEAQKIGVDVSPVGAREAAEMIDKLAAAPPDLLDYIKKLQ